MQALGEKHASSAPHKHKPLTQAFDVVFEQGGERPQVHDPALHVSVAAGSHTTQDGPQPFEQMQFPLLQTRGATHSRFVPQVHELKSAPSANDGSQHLALLNASRLIWEGLLKQ
jgi:hypothetical protein